MRRIELLQEVIKMRLRCIRDMDRAKEAALMLGVSDRTLMICFIRQE